MTGLQILILYRTGSEPQFGAAVLNFNRTAVPSLIGPQVLIRTELNFKNWFEPANMELFNIPIFKPNPTLIVYLLYPAKSVRLPFFGGDAR